MIIIIIMKTTTNNNNNNNIYTPTFPSRFLHTSPKSHQN